MLRKHLAAFLSSLYLASNVVLAHAYESNVWAERQRSLQQPKKSTNNMRLASLPSSITNTPLTTTNDLIRQLPELRSSIDAVKSQTRPSRTPSLPVSISNLLDSISLNSGLIKEIHLSPSASGSKSFVCLVQDVHLNREAQQNIAKILGALAEESGRSGAGEQLVIGVEGAFTSFDFTRFRAFPDKKINRAVASYFLKENKIAAPSFLGITFDGPLPRFEGVDDPVHYRANLEAYLQSIPQKESLLKKVSGWKTIVAQQKQEKFNPDLKLFDGVQEKYQSNAIGLGEYVLTLQRLSESAPGEEPDDLEFVLEQFLTAYKMEKSLDMGRVERERKRVIENLATRISKEQLNELVLLGLAYRSGRISYGDYYGAILSLMKSNSLSLLETPAFNDFIRYVLLSDGIKPDALFEAVRRLETSLLNRLCRTPEEKELMSRSRLVYLMEKLLDFALTPQEWEEYRKLSAVSLQLSANKFDSSSADGGQLSAESFKTFERFYEEADIRSQKMVERLLANPKSEARNPNFNTPVANALVTGGFHTTKLTDLLKARGLSYAVIQPKVTKLDGLSGVEYLSIFTREKSSLDRLFAGEKLFLAVNSHAAGTFTADAAATSAQILVTEAALTFDKGLPIPAETQVSASYADRERTVIDVTYGSPAKGQASHFYVTTRENGVSPRFTPLGAPVKVPGEKSVQILTPKTSILQRLAAPFGSFGSFVNGFIANAELQPSLRPFYSVMSSIFIGAAVAIAAGALLGLSMPVVMALVAAVAISSNWMIRRSTLLQALIRVWIVPPLEYPFTLLQTFTPGHWFVNWHLEKELQGVEREEVKVHLTRGMNGITLSTLAAIPYIALFGVPFAGLFMGLDIYLLPALQAVGLAANFSFADIAVHWQVLIRILLLIGVFQSIAHGAFSANAIKQGKRTLTLPPLQAAKLGSLIVHIATSRLFLLVDNGDDGTGYAVLLEQTRDPGFRPYPNNTRLFGVHPESSTHDVIRHRNLIQLAKLLGIEFNSQDIRYPLSILPLMVEDLARDASVKAWTHIGLDRDMADLNQSITGRARRALRGSQEALAGLIEDVQALYTVHLLNRFKPDYFGDKIRQPQVLQALIHLFTEMGLLARSGPGYRVGRNLNGWSKDEDSMELLTTYDLDDALQRAYRLLIVTEPATEASSAEVAVPPQSGFANVFINNESQTIRVQLNVPFPNSEEAVVLVMPEGKQPYLIIIPTGSLSKLSKLDRELDSTELAFAARAQRLATILAEGGLSNALRNNVPAVERTLERVHARLRNEYIAPNLRNLPNRAIDDDQTFRFVEHVRNWLRSMPQRKAEQKNPLRERIQRMLVDFYEQRSYGGHTLLYRHRTDGGYHVLTDGLGHTTRVEDVDEALDRANDFYNEYKSDVTINTTLTTLFTLTVGWTLAIGGSVVFLAYAFNSSNPVVLLIAALLLVYWGIESALIQKGYEQTMTDGLIKVLFAGVFESIFYLPFDFLFFVLGKITGDKNRQHWFVLKHFLIEETLPNGERRLRSKRIDELTKDQKIEFDGMVKDNRWIRWSVALSAMLVLAALMGLLGLIGFDESLSALQMNGYLTGLALAPPAVVHGPLINTKRLWKGQRALTTAPPLASGETQKTNVGAAIEQLNPYLTVRDQLVALGQLLQDNDGLQHSPEFNDRMNQDKVISLFIYEIMGEGNIKGRYFRAEPNSEEALDLLRQMIALAAKSVGGFTSKLNEYSENVAPEDVATFKALQERASGLLVLLQGLQLKSAALTPSFGEVEIDIFGDLKRRKAEPYLLPQKHRLHDMNNLLTPIMGTIGMAVKDFALQASPRERINHIQKRLNHFNETFSGLHYHFRKMSSNVAKATEVHDQIMRNSLEFADWLGTELEMLSQEVGELPDWEKYSGPLNGALRRFREMAQTGLNGQQEDPPSPLDIGTLIVNSKPLWDIVAGPDTVVEVKNNTKGPVLVQAQPQRFSRISVNLITNAARAIRLREPKVDGKITVTLSQTRTGKVRLYVRDNGVGVPQGKTGGALFKGGQSTKKEDGFDHGLGLPSVKESVAVWGAKVWARARSDRQQGAEFTIEWASAKPPKTLTLPFTLTVGWALAMGGSLLLIVLALQSLNPYLLSISALLIVYWIIEMILIQKGYEQTMTDGLIKVLFAGVFESIVYLPFDFLFFVLGKITGDKNRQHWFVLKHFLIEETLPNGEKRVRSKRIDELTKDEKVEFDGMVKDNQWIRWSVALSFMLVLAALMGLLGFIGFDETLSAWQMNGYLAGLALAPPAVVHGPLINTKRLWKGQRALTTAPHRINSTDKIILEGNGTRLELTEEEARLMVAIVWALEGNRKEALNAWKNRNTPLEVDLRDIAARYLLYRNRLRNQTSGTDYFSRVRIEILMDGLSKPADVARIRAWLASPQCPLYTLGNKLEDLTSITRGHSLILLKPDTSGLTPLEKRFISGVLNVKSSLSMTDTIVRGASSFFSPPEFTDAMLPEFIDFISNHRGDYNSLVGYYKLSAGADRYPAIHHWYFGDHADSAQQSVLRKLLPARKTLGLKTPNPVDVARQWRRWIMKDITDPDLRSDLIKVIRTVINAAPERILDKQQTPSIDELELVQYARIMIEDSVAGALVESYFTRLFDRRVFYRTDYISELYRRHQDHSVYLPMVTLFNSLVLGLFTNTGLKGSRTREELERLRSAVDSMNDRIVELMNEEEFDTRTQNHLLRVNELLMEPDPGAPQKAGTTGTGAFTLGLSDMLLSPGDFRSKFAKLQDNLGAPESLTLTVSDDQEFETVYPFQVFDFKSFGLNNGYQRRAARLIGYALTLLFANEESKKKYMGYADNMHMLVGGGYHNFHETTANYLLGASYLDPHRPGSYSWSKDVRPEDVFRHFERRGWDTVIDTDLVADIVNALGGKNGGNVNILRLVGRYLENVYVFETTQEKAKFKQAFTYLSKETHKYSKPVLGRPKVYVENSTDQNRWRLTEANPLQTLRPKNGSNNKRVVPAKPFEIVQAANPDEFLRDAVERSRTGEAPFLIFNQFWEHDGRLWMLACRDGEPELYYTSVSYSKVSGQFQWQKHEALLLTIVKDPDGELRVSMDWYGKGDQEDIHQMPAEANQAVNELVARGLEGKTVKIHKGGNDGKANEPFLSQLAVRLRVAYSPLGEGISLNDQGQPQYGNRAGIWADVASRYTSWLYYGMMAAARHGQDLDIASAYQKVEKWGRPPKNNRLLSPAEKAMRLQPAKTLTLDSTLFIGRIFILGLTGLIAAACLYFSDSYSVMFLGSLISAGLAALVVFVTISADNKERKITLLDFIVRTVFAGYWEAFYLIPDLWHARRAARLTEEATRLESDLPSGPDRAAQLEKIQQLKLMAENHENWFVLRHFKIKDLQTGKLRQPSIFELRENPEFSPDYQEFLILQEENVRIRASAKRVPTLGLFIGLAASVASGLLVVWLDIPLFVKILIVIISGLLGLSTPPALTHIDVNKQKILRGRPRRTREEAAAPQRRGLEPSNENGVAAVTLASSEHPDVNGDAYAVRVLPNGIVIAIVADGMSGYTAKPGGKYRDFLASRIATYETLGELTNRLQSVDPTSADVDYKGVVQEAMHRANKVIKGEFPDPANLAGTTLLVTVITRNRVVIGNVGNSRAYAVRNDGRYEPLTIDDVSASATAEERRDAEWKQDYLTHVSGKKAEDPEDGDAGPLFGTPVAETMGGELFEKFVFGRRSKMQTGVFSGDIPFDPDVQEHPLANGETVVLQSDGLDVLSDDAKKDIELEHRGKTDAAIAHEYLRQALAVDESDVRYGPDDITQVRVREVADMTVPAFDQFESGLREEVSQALDRARDLIASNDLSNAEMNMDIVTRFMKRLTPGDALTTALQQRLNVISPAFDRLKRSRQTMTTRFTLKAGHWFSRIIVAFPIFLLTIGSYLMGAPLIISLILLVPSLTLFVAVLFQIRNKEFVSDDFLRTRFAGPFESVVLFIPAVLFRIRGMAKLLLTRTHSEDDFNWFIRRHFLIQDPVTKKTRAMTYEEIRQDGERLKIYSKMKEDNRAIRWRFAVGLGLLAVFLALTYAEQAFGFGSWKTYAAAFLLFFAPPSLKHNAINVRRLKDGEPTMTVGDERLQGAIDRLLEMPEDVSDPNDLFLELDGILDQMADEILQEEQFGKYTALIEAARELSNRLKDIQFVEGLSDDHAAALFRSLQTIILMVSSLEQGVQNALRPPLHEQWEWTRVFLDLSVDLGVSENKNVEAQASFITILTKTSNFLLRFQGYRGVLSRFENEEEEPVIETLQNILFEIIKPRPAEIGNFLALIGESVLNAFRRITRTDEPFGLRFLTFLELVDHDELTQQEVETFMGPLKKLWFHPNKQVREAARSYAITILPLLAQSDREALTLHAMRYLPPDSAAWIDLIESITDLCANPESKRFIVNHVAPRLVRVVESAPQAATREAARELLQQLNQRSLVHEEVVADALGIDQFRTIEMGKDLASDATIIPLPTAASERLYEIISIVDKWSKTPDILDFQHAFEESVSDLTHPEDKAEIARLLIDLINNEFRAEWMRQRRNFVSRFIYALMSWTRNRLSDAGMRISDGMIDPRIQRQIRLIYNLNRTLYGADEILLHQAADCLLGGLNSESSLRYPDVLRALLQVSSTLPLYLLPNSQSVLRKRLAFGYTQFIGQTWRKGRPDVINLLSKFPLLSIYNDSQLDRFERINLINILLLNIPVDDVYWMELKKNPAVVSLLRERADLSLDPDVQQAAADVLAAKNFRRDFYLRTLWLGKVFYFITAAGLTLFGGVALLEADTNPLAYPILALGLILFRLLTWEKGANSLIQITFAGLWESLVHLYIDALFLFAGRQSGSLLHQNWFVLLHFPEVDLNNPAKVEELFRSDEFKKMQRDYAVIRVVAAVSFFIAILAFLYMGWLDFSLRQAALNFVGITVLPPALAHNIINVRRLRRGERPMTVDKAAQGKIVHTTLSEEINPVFQKTKAYIDSLIGERTNLVDQLAAGEDAKKRSRLRAIEEAIFLLSPPHLLIPEKPFTDEHSQKPRDLKVIEARVEEAHYQIAPIGSASDLPRYVRDFNLFETIASLRDQAKKTGLTEIEFAELFDGGQGIRKVIQRINAFYHALRLSSLTASRTIEEPEFINDFNALYVDGMTTKEIAEKVKKQQQTRLDEMGLVGLFDVIAAHGASETFINQWHSDKNIAAKVEVYKKAMEETPLGLRGVVQAKAEEAGLSDRYLSWAHQNLSKGLWNDVVQQILGASIYCEVERQRKLLGVVQPQTEAIGQHWLDFLIALYNQRFDSFIPTRRDEKPRNKRPISDLMPTFAEANASNGKRTLESGKQDKLSDEGMRWYLTSFWSDEVSLSGFIGILSSEQRARGTTNNLVNAIKKDLLAKSSLSNTSQTSSYYAHDRSDDFWIEFEVPEKMKPAPMKKDVVPPTATERKDAPPAPLKEDPKQRENLEIFDRSMTALRALDLDLPPIGILKMKFQEDCLKKSVRDIVLGVVTSFGALESSNDDTFDRAGLVRREAQSKGSNEAAIFLCRMIQARLHRAELPPDKASDHKINQIIQIQLRGVKSPQWVQSCQDAVYNEMDNREPKIHRNETNRANVLKQIEVLLSFMPQEFQATVPGYTLPTTATKEAPAAGKQETPAGDKSTPAAHPAHGLPAKHGQVATLAPNGGQTGAQAKAGGINAADAGMVSKPAPAAPPAGQFSPSAVQQEATKPVQPPTVPTDLSLSAVPAPEKTPSSPHELGDYIWSMNNAKSAYESMGLRFDNARYTALMEELKKAVSPGKTINFADYIYRMIKTSTNYADVLGKWKTPLDDVNSATSQALAQRIALTYACLAMLRNKNDENDDGVLRRIPSIIKTTAYDRWPDDILDKFERSFQDMGIDRGSGRHSAALKKAKIVFSPSVGKKPLTLPSTQIAGHVFFLSIIFPWGIWALYQIIGGVILGQFTVSLLSVVTLALPGLLLGALFWDLWENDGRYLEHAVVTIFAGYFESIVFLPFDLIFAAWAKWLRFRAARLTRAGRTDKAKELIKRAKNRETWFVRLHFRWEDGAKKGRAKTFEEVRKPRFERDEFDEMVQDNNRIRIAAIFLILSLPLAVGLYDLLGQLDAPILTRLSAALLMGLAPPSLRHDGINVRRVREGKRPMLVAFKGRLKDLGERIVLADWKSVFQLLIIPARRYSFLVGLALGAPLLVPGLPILYASLISMTLYILHNAFITVRLLFFTQITFEEARDMMTSQRNRLSKEGYDRVRLKEFLDPFFLKQTIGLNNRVQAYQETMAEIDSLETLDATIESLALLLSNAGPATLQTDYTSHVLDEDTASAESYLILLAERLQDQRVADEIKAVIHIPQRMASSLDRFVELTKGKGVVIEVYNAAKGPALQKMIGERGLPVGLFASKKALGGATLQTLRQLYKVYPSLALHGLNLAKAAQTVFPISRSELDRLAGQELRKEKQLRQAA